MPNNHCSVGVKQRRYAFVQSDDRLHSSGAPSVRHAAKIAGHARRHARRRMWIGSRPYHARDMEITEIFRDSPKLANPALSADASDCASASVRLLRGKNNRRKKRNRASLSRAMLASGNCVTIVCALACSSRSRHAATHSSSTSGGTPYKRSLPTSVKSAVVGSGGRSRKSCQSAQGKIPEIFLPKTVESWPYERPWPMAAIISTGSPQVRRTVSTTVANEIVRLLAPSRTTRRVGVTAVTNPLFRP